MKKVYYFAIFGAIILIMFSFLNIFKNKDKDEGAQEASIKKTIILNENFELKEGDRAEIEDLSIFYKNTSFPPDSYTGDREEFTYPQIEVSENGDTLIFPINKNFPSKVFHRYEFVLINTNINEQERVITLELKKKDINARVLEEEAVLKALEEASKNDIDEPDALNRVLEYGLWKIEVVSKTMSDSYIIVEIDANTGEIRNSYKENRA